VHEYTATKKLVESMETHSLHSAMRLNELNRRRGTDDLEGYLTAEEA